MKKVIFISLMMVSCALFPSCKKDYTCECSLNGDTLKGDSLPITNSSKSNAISTCDNHADELQNGNKDIHCKLK